MAIMTQEQVNRQLDQNYQLSEIRAFLRIAEDMGIIEKDLNNVEVETETLKYENFDSEMTWENEVNIELDNILSDYNLAEALAVEIEGPERIFEEKSIHELLVKYADIIYTDVKELAKTNIIQHTIHLLNSTPIAQECCPMDQRDRNWLKKELDELLEKGIIRESMSPWAIPIVIVGKKNGSRRMCLDFRKPNKVTKKNQYPIPRQTEIFASFGGAGWFTSLDLASGYWQVEMEPKSREVTAFITPWGLFEWNRMPFGLCNAPATFQRLMNQVLRKYLEKFILVYLDDIIIYSKMIEEYKEHIRLVFEALRAASLMMKLKKCKFAQKELRFLGHIISAEGIRTDPDKITKMVTMSPLTNLKELRSRLGLFSYYRQFIKGFSDIMRPMYELTREENGKAVQFEWTAARQKPFEIIKAKLATAPVVAHPNFDKPFVLYTDVSDGVVGAVLYQKGEDGRERIIVCASRTYNEHERKYPITEQECLAVVWDVEKFKQFLSVKPFKIITDHMVLETIKTVDLPSRRRARWLCKLQQYEFTIEHRKGNRIAHVDALSRA